MKKIIFGDLENQILQLENKRTEERRIERIKNEIKTKNYIYNEKINEDEQYAVEQIDSTMGDAVWSIEKITDNGTKYTKINTINVTTPSKIKFFENGLGFLERPTSIYCGKADLLVTHDSGKTFHKINFPSGTFTLSDSEGKDWEECYDYFYLPTLEDDGTLTVLASGGYEGGYNQGKTRAKYISQDNGYTWKFISEVYTN